MMFVLWANRIHAIKTTLRYFRSRYMGMALCITMHHMSTIFDLFMLISEIYKKCCVNDKTETKQCVLVEYIWEYIWIFTLVSWALYKNKCGSFCMNRTTFRDLWVGGVSMKTCIIALRRSTFWKEKKKKM